MLGVAMLLNMLLNMAVALQLHSGYGARHQRPSDLGVAEYWRRERNELRACMAATNALQFVRRCVDEEFRFE